MYKRFLVPMDGSEHAKHALKSALWMAQSAGEEAHLMLLHIIPNDNTMAYGVDVHKLQVEEGFAILDSSAKELAGTSISFEKEYKVGDPAEMICKIAKEGNYDLIIMGSRGLSLFSELFVGSVSHKVVQRAHCAVMIIK